MKRLGIAFVGIVLAALWAPSATAQDRGTGGSNQATTRWQGPHFEISILNRGRPLRDWSFDRSPEERVENNADLVITNNAKNQGNAPYRIIVQSQEMDSTSASALRGSYDSDNHAEQIENNVRGNSGEWRSVRQVSKARASGSRFPIAREGGTALVLACTPASGGDEIEMRFYCFQSMRNQRVYTIYAVVPKVEDPRAADDPEIRAILGSFSAHRPR